MSARGPNTYHGGGETPTSPWLPLLIQITAAAARNYFLPNESHSVRGHHVEGLQLPLLGNPVLDLNAAPPHGVPTSPLFDYYGHVIDGPDDRPTDGWAAITWRLTDGSVVDLALLGITPGTIFVEVALTTPDGVTRPVTDRQMIQNVITYSQATLEDVLPRLT